MPDLMKVKCRHNAILTITDQAIRLESGKRLQAMPRASLSGIESVRTVAAFMGVGGNVDLIFRGQGTEVIRAEWVKPDEAKQVMELLGY